MKTRFKGHESFFFREGWLSKALFELYARNNHSLFSENNGILKLGVGSNMVKSIKYWLTTTNLLTYSRGKRSYELTELGKLVAANDIYLEDVFTLWLLHINIVRNYSEATSWSLFFNEFKAEKFKIEDTKRIIKEYLDVKDIKYAEKSLDTDINVLLSMYTKEKINKNPEENLICPLSQLELLKKNKDIYVKNIPNIELINIDIVLYAIILQINELKNDNFISLSDLEKGNNSLSNLFHFDRVIINDYLEQLSSLGYVRVVRTAGLDIVYLNTNKSAIDIVREYYERRGNK